METLPPNESGVAYFALPRLIQQWRGGSPARSENNWIEACVASAGIYLMSYVFAANFVLERLSLWSSIFVFVLLLPGIWILWLIVLYLNSLIVKACWICGALTRSPRNRIQGVLVGTLTTLIAANVAMSGTWLRWIGVIWIIVVTLNLIAAVLLALLYGEHS
jgi:hypothetical protein